MDDDDLENPIWSLDAEWPEGTEEDLKASRLFTVEAEAEAYTTDVSFWDAREKELALTDVKAQVANLWCITRRILKRL